MLQLNRNGAVATLILDRPDLHNAFNAELITAITEACVSLRDDRSVRVVVLAANGRSFCAGADINWMQNSLHFSHAQNLDDAGRLDAMYTALDNLPQAVIARVQGTAMGGGVGLVACADLAIASTQASFALSEVRLGILPAVIARFVVPKIGYGMARALFTTARRISADDALRCGLVQQVVAPEALDQAVAEAINEILRNSPAAVAEAKALARAALYLPRDEMRHYAINAIADIRTSPEGQAGLRAFLNKQAPPWQP